MTPLIVTANLRSGFASSFPWSVSLDGILAYQLVREEMGDDEFISTHGLVHLQKPVTGLPLAVERYGDDWWYQCSAPIYHSFAKHTTHLHRRFNAVEAETLVSGKVAAIQTTKGPYKNARLAITRHVTDKVIWCCIGNADEIKRLLLGVTHIGSQRRSGFGAVRGWRVEPGGDEAKARFARPLPKEFAAAHGVAGNLMEWAIRPPARHPDNQRACIIPEMPHAG